MSACAGRHLPLVAGRASRQHGPPAALLEPPQEVRPGLPLLPRVLQPPRPHPQVRPEHVPAVLPPVRQGYRLHQAGLSAGRVRLSPEAPRASLTHQ